MECPLIIKCGHLRILSFRTMASYFNATTANDGIAFKVQIIFYTESFDICPRYYKKCQRYLNGSAALIFNHSQGAQSIYATTTAAETELMAGEVL